MGNEIKTNYDMTGFGGIDYSRAKPLAPVDWQARFEALEEAVEGFLTFLDARNSYEGIEGNYTTMVYSDSDYTSGWTVQRRANGSYQELISCSLNYSLVLTRFLESEKKDPNLDDKLAKLESELKSNEWNRREIEKQIERIKREIPHE